jgi:ribosomal protein L11 methyltransferase
MFNRKWHQFTIAIPASHQDLLSGQLALLGFTGFQQEENSLFCFIPVKASESIDKSLDSTLKRFANEFPELKLRVSHKIIHEENWNAQWESQTGIVEATKSILIRPSWKKLRAQDKGKIVLHIDPKMSFGTGHHETTRLCLTLLEKYLQKGSKVLDFGCGTGVLSIACIKLGGSSAVAVDNSDWAFSNACENVKKNRVGKEVRVLLGSADTIPNRAYDLIVANINVPSILAFLPALSRDLVKGKMIILSGILTTDFQELIGPFIRQHLSVVEVITENEWLAVVVSKN